MHILLVTVDYLNGSLDLGLPAEVPMMEFLPMLLEVCGLAKQEGDPPSEEWELAIYGGETLPMTRSLQSCGVIDGMRLVLQNLATQESLGSRPVSGRVHVFPYPPAGSEAEGPRVRWIREDLFTE